MGIYAVYALLLATSIRPADAAEPEYSPRLPEDEEVTKSEYWRDTSVRGLEDAVTTFRGKHVFVYVYGSTCSACKDTKPMLEKVGKRLLAETVPGELDLVAVNKDQLSTQAITKVFKDVFPHSFTNVRNKKTGKSDPDNIWVPSMWYVHVDDRESIIQMMPPLPAQSVSGDIINKLPYNDKNMHKAMRDHIYEVSDYQRLPKEEMKSRKAPKIDL